MCIMIKFFKILLSGLVLCTVFTGCSMVNTPNVSVPDMQNKSGVKSNEFEFSVVTLDELPSIKYGTKMEVHWAFSYIRYGGESYVISLNSAVKKGRVGRQIGVVKRFLPSSIVISGNKFTEEDGDTNYLGVGSPIYSFKGKHVKEAIIVKDKGVFKQAIPYSVWSFYSYLRNQKRNIISKEMYYYMEIDK